MTQRFCHPPSAAWLSCLALLCLSLATAAPAAATSPVEFVEIGFYEGGDGEDPPADWNDTRLRTRFAGSDARSIYTLVSLRNHRWQVEDQDVALHLRYYDSGGNLVGNPVIEYRIPSDWEYAELWNGWGWNRPGEWQPGRYRVELWLDNRRKIGENHFEIY